MERRTSKQPTFDAVVGTEKPPSTQDISDKERVTTMQETVIVQGFLDGKARAFEAEFLGNRTDGTVIEVSTDTAANVGSA